MGDTHETSTGGYLDNPHGVTDSSTEPSRESFVASFSVSQLSPPSDAPRGDSGASGSAELSVAPDSTEGMFRRDGSESALHGSWQAYRFGGVAGIEGGVSADGLFEETRVRNEFVGNGDLSGCFGGFGKFPANEELSGIAAAVGLFQEFPGGGFRSTQVRVPHGTGHGRVRPVQACEYVTESRIGQYVTKVRTAEKETSEVGGGQVITDDLQGILGQTLERGLWMGSVGGYGLSRDVTMRVGPGTAVVACSTFPLFGGLGLPTHDPTTFQVLLAPQLIFVQDFRHAVLLLLLLLLLWGS